MDSCTVDSRQPFNQSPSDLFFDTGPGACPAQFAKVSPKENKGNQRKPFAKCRNGLRPVPAPFSGARIPQKNGLPLSLGGPTYVGNYGSKLNHTQAVGFRPFHSVPFPYFCAAPSFALSILQVNPFSILSMFAPHTNRSSALKNGRPRKPRHPRRLGSWRFRSAAPRSPWGWALPAAACPR